MATSNEFAEYVCEQLGDIGAIRCKKMFGEFMVYVNDKPLVIVCDNTAFVRKADCLQKMMAEAETGFPYDGAKEHYVLDIDNGEFSKAVVAALEKATALPKPKKRKPN